MRDENPLLALAVWALCSFGGLAFIAALDALR